jgi:hypothetical protein
MASDLWFLAALFTLSSILYAAQLGFYSDDWSFLYAMQQKAEPGFWGSAARLIREDLPTRPGQAMLLVALFRAFGLTPSPYHLFNTAVTGLTVLLFYIALRKVGTGRLFAFPAAALYGLLPHYSTDRFWVSSFQAPLSMALYFVTLLSGFRTVVAQSAAARATWGTVTVASLVASALCYEVAVPLLFLNMWLWWREARLRGQVKPVVLAWVSAGAVVAVSVFKAMFTNRMEHANGWTGYVWWLFRTSINPFYTREHAGFNFYFAVFTNFVQDGLLLPWSAWRTAGSLWTGELGWTMAVALGAGTILFGVTYALSRRAGEPEWRLAGSVFASGIVVFFLGYAIFATNGNVQFTPTGIANRTAIAAALGVVLALAGGWGWVVSRKVGAEWRPLVYSLPLAVLGACGCFVVNALGSSWITAYRDEVRVLDAVAAVSPHAPPGKTVLLDGVCPYLGAAPVFESSWDFAGALSLRYRTPEALQGDVVSPQLSVQPTGLEVAHYEGEVHAYAYTDDLVIFDARDGTVHRVPDKAAAVQYFERSQGGATLQCARSTPGLGVTIY